MVVCFLALAFALLVFCLIFCFVELFLFVFFFCFFFVFMTMEKYWNCFLKYVLSSENAARPSTSFPSSSLSNLVLKNICNILNLFRTCKILRCYPFPLLSSFCVCVPSYVHSFCYLLVCYLPVYFLISFIEVRLFIYRAPG